MFDAITLDRDAARPLHRQLYSALRELILAGDLGPGLRLPSTRAVAADLGVSRNTVVTAFEQLGAEGFVELKVGVGTRVSDVGQTRSPVRTNLAPGSRLSERGAALSRPQRETPDSAHAFASGIPDLGAFPRATWARLLARRARSGDASLLGYGHAGGYRPLRDALSSYLRTSRGLPCTPEQVIVVSSAQSGLDLATRLVVNPAEHALVEDPGYPGARAALEGAGLDVTAVPVDDEGFDITQAGDAARTARLAYITPSHQYPTGVTMTVPRRLALIEWANRGGRWIIEDDYDSEFHYDVRPVPSLQGLADTAQVITLGTFAKTLQPAMRMAYVVVPADLAPAFQNAIRHTGQEPALVMQAALADFIEEGHFARHLRRTRRLYQEKRAVLLKTLDAESHHRLSLAPASGGLQVCVLLDDAADDIVIAQRAQDSGLAVQALSRYCAESPGRRGLVLGFASTPREAISDAAMRLVEIIDESFTTM